MQVCLIVPHQSCVTGCVGLGGAVHGADRPFWTAAGPTLITAVTLPRLHSDYKDAICVFSQDNSITKVGYSIQKSTVQTGARLMTHNPK